MSSVLRLSLEERLTLSPDIQRISAALHHQWKPHYIVIGHCTGEPTFALLQKTFQDRYIYAGVGTVVNIPRTYTILDEGSPIWKHPRRVSAEPCSEFIPSTALVDDLAFFLFSLRHFLWKSGRCVMLCATFTPKGDSTRVHLPGAVQD